MCDQQPRTRGGVGARHNSSEDAVLLLENRQIALGVSANHLLLCLLVVRERILSLGQHRLVIGLSEVFSCIRMNLSIECRGAILGVGPSTIEQTGAATNPHDELSGFIPEEGPTRCGTHRS